MSADVLRNLEEIHRNKLASEKQRNVLHVSGERFKTDVRERQTSQICEANRAFVMQQTSLRYTA